MGTMDSLAATLSPLLPFVASFMFLVIFLEQISYLKKKRSVPGPALVLPFVGNAIPLVRNPARFWEIQASLAKSSGLGFSVNYIAGKFIVLTTDTELSHKIFANVRSDAMDLVGHPFGKKLFGEENMMYMSGQKHKDLRRRIAPNFTPKALSTYTALQQIMILKHLKLWDQKSSESSPKPIPLRFLARDLNLEASQSVFVGPYLSEQDREKFRVDYNIFNVGLMKLPIDLPGTGFRNAKRAADGLVEVLSGCAKQSKARMRREEEPSCLIDFWMQDTVKELADAAEAGQPEPVHTSNFELGMYLFDFLFAAQDASSSSLLWAVSLLDSHPEVVAKVRDEVESIWSPESDSLISSEQLLEMKYTQAVAREVVRYRAPATVVPHVAAADFPLTEFYTIPKGAIVFPSAYESCLQGFVEPDRFDPERFSDERQEDRIFKRNYLAFGAGSHQCVGQRYALNQLVLFIAMFCTLLDFKRHRSDGCDEIAFNPTICPKDDCMVSMRRRCARFPNLSLNN